MTIHIEFALGKGLVDVDANIYVNAASIYPLSVQGWGGVAGSIRVALQNDALSYQTLLNDWAKKDEHIPKGTADFVKDNLGNPVTLLWPKNHRAYLIHAGAPDSGNEYEREALLTQAYQAILQCAQSILPLFQSSITLAIAPLGIGIYGNPPEISAKAALNAIHAFKKCDFPPSFSIIFPLYNKTPDSSDKLFQQAFSNSSS